MKWNCETRQGRVWRGKARRGAVGRGRAGGEPMTIGYKHLDVDVEVYLDGVDEIACRKKLEELCAKRTLPSEGWAELGAEVDETVEASR